MSGPASERGSPSRRRGRSPSTQGDENPSSSQRRRLNNNNTSTVELLINAFSNQTNTMAQTLVNTMLEREANRTTQINTLIADVRTVNDSIARIESHMQTQNSMNEARQRLLNLSNVGGTGLMIAI